MRRTRYTGAPHWEAELHPLLQHNQTYDKRHAQGQHHRSGAAEPMPTPVPGEQHRAGNQQDDMKWDFHKKLLFDWELLVRHTMPGRLPSIAHPWRVTTQTNCSWLQETALVASVAFESDHPERNQHDERHFVVTLH